MPEQSLETPEGLPIGTMCVLDYKPRELTDKEAFTLKILARQVMIQLELRRSLKAKNQSEEQLRASVDALSVSELRYRRHFEAAQDGVLILNAETGRIEDVNPFLMKLLKFSRSEMVGKTVGELSPFKDIESNHAMLERLQQHGYVRYEDLPLKNERRTQHCGGICLQCLSVRRQKGDPMQRPRYHGAKADRSALPTTGGFQCTRCGFLELERRNYRRERCLSPSHSVLARRSGGWTHYTGQADSTRICRTRSPRH